MCLISLLSFIIIYQHYLYQFVLPESLKESMLGIQITLYVYITDNSFSANTQTTRISCFFYSFYRYTHIPNTMNIIQISTWCHRHLIQLRFRYVIPY